MSTSDYIVSEIGDRQIESLTDLACALIREAGTLYDHDEALKKLDQALGLVNELKSLRYFAPLPKRELREVTSSRVTDPQVAIAEAPATSVPVS
jgi:hypothetical protein|tara:strand:+ start:736 stop:1017 length:282 start_codon:yes stop_codon:yes gene_type:complete